MIGKKSIYLLINRKNNGGLDDILASWMVQEIKEGQKDGSIQSDASPQTLFLNLWAYLIWVTNLTNPSTQQAPINILGEKM